MNWEQALEAMREGHPVRMPDWPYGIRLGPTGSGPFERINPDGSTALWRHVPAMEALTGWVLYR